MEKKIDLTSVDAALFTLRKKSNNVAVEKILSGTWTRKCFRLFWYFRICMIYYRLIKALMVVRET